jgi:hypothetical protein
MAPATSTIVSSVTAADVFFFTDDPLLDVVVIS